MELSIVPAKITLSNVRVTLNILSLNPNHISNVTKSFLNENLGLSLPARRRDFRAANTLSPALPNLHRGVFKPYADLGVMTVTKKIKLHKAVTSHEKNRTETMDRPRAKHINK